MQTSPEPGDIPPVSALALLLMELEGVPAKLVAAHTRDDQGYCRGCALPQSGWQVWPCTLFTIARQADDLDRARRLPRRAGPQPPRDHHP